MNTEMNDLTEVAHRSSKRVSTNLEKVFESATINSKAKNQFPTTETNAEENPKNEKKKRKKPETVLSEDKAPVKIEKLSPKKKEKVKVEKPVEKGLEKDPGSKKVAQIVPPKAKDLLDALVIEYYQKQNRPYNLLNLFDNLHGKYKKPDLLAALNRLVLTEQLIHKDFNKNIVYWPNQSLIKIDEKTLELEKNRFGELKNEIETNRRVVTDLKNNLSNIEKTPTTVSLNEKIEKTEMIILKLKEELNDYQSNQVLLVPEIEIQQAEQKITIVAKIKNQRQKILKNMIESLIESTGLSRTALLEKIGIE